MPSLFWSGNSLINLLLRCAKVKFFQIKVSLGKPLCGTSNQIVNWVNLNKSNGIKIVFFGRVFRICSTIYLRQLRVKIVPNQSVLKRITHETPTLQNPWPLQKDNLLIGVRWSILDQGLQSNHHLSAEENSAANHFP